MTPLLYLFLIIFGVALIVFNHSMAKNHQRNLGKIIGDPNDKWGIVSRRIEALFIGIVSLAVGLTLLIKFVWANL